MNTWEIAVSKVDTNKFSEDHSLKSFFYYVNKAPAPKDIGFVELVEISYAKELEDEIKNSNKFAQDQEDKIAELEEKLRMACEKLNSIAANSCCQPCREAGLVAKEALNKINPTK